MKTISINGFTSELVGKNLNIKVVNPEQKNNLNVDKPALKISMLDNQMNLWSRAKKSQEPDYYSLFMENLTFIDLYLISKTAFKNWVNDFCNQNDYPEPQLYSKFVDELQELENNFENFTGGLYQYFWEEFSNQIIEIVREGF